ncbi:hypothetical protein [Catenuloplanes indicus]|uniref:Uncharacterized protein n=1 Tax=Catenuloplanes indicus TaxID=137267 RepID=A0AAE3VYT4_9ACTN|nr:hypothetical protein [Catenuloplanes indicus]MDQ0366351.1 hypothetical protein [Catenuloplanes indicus]
MEPKVGDVLIVDRQASVQFNGANALILRVISVSDRATYDGWAWVLGYVVDPVTGEATVRREVFVLRGGLRRAAPERRPMRKVER